MESKIRQKTTKWASLPPGLLLAVLLWPMGAQADPPCPVLEATHVQVGKQRFRVEVAAGAADRERGLSGRASLPVDAGMWFVLPASGPHGFWMKDMEFAVDLVWISQGREVIGVERLAPCGAFHCPTHYAPRPAAYVLEVNEGVFAGKPGDRADWFRAP
jgi:uncharacterized membrane protein (UPF0127 family)